MTPALAFVALVPFTLLLSIGISSSPRELTFIVRHPALLLRALLAVVVLVPAFAILLLKVFDLSPDVSSGIALLAAAPGAPLITKRSEVAAASRTYVTSLQLLLGLLAIVVTPWTLAVFDALFDLPFGRVSPAAVAGQVAQVALLPVLLGLVVRRVAPRFAARAETPVKVLANVLFMLLVVVLVGLIVFDPELRAKLLVGWQAFAAISLLALAAIVAGHLLGGPRADHRAGLVTASVARNLGLVMFLAGMEVDANEIVRTVLVYALVGFVVAMPYSLRIRRQVRGAPGQPDSLAAHAH
jgi:BASS family bile acid:Na+ symporter